MPYKILTYPMYDIYHPSRLGVEKIEDFRQLGEKQVQILRWERSAAEIESWMAALEWAAEHPEFDYNSLLPNLGHSNEAIHTYLCGYGESLAKAFRENQPWELDPDMV